MTRVLSVLAIMIIWLGGSSVLSGQPVYEHISHRGIYSFLDEMAAEGLIRLNTTTKPYTRTFIYKKLNKLQSHQNRLNKRQRGELDFYLQDFAIADSTTTEPCSGNTILDLFSKNNHAATNLNPPGFYYKNESFSLGIRPVWGIEHLNNENGAFTRTWGGARMYGSIGDHLGIYASLRDNHMSGILSKPEYFTQREGGVYKGNSIGGGDYSEMRGGIVYSWKWGQVGLIKDHLTWGDHYHGGNILSGRTPSFAMIKLRLKPVNWFRFNYFHGWLVSEVKDSIRSYSPVSGFKRPVYKPKYMAANMFTFMPSKGIDVSFGNSIIYSDLPVQAGYLIPFMFFKSIDHTINAHIENQNSQMFGNISIKRIPHVHAFASLFVDEFSVERIGDPNRHNFSGYKTGARVYNWPVQNISITAEYTETSPLPTNIAFLPSPLLPINIALATI
jgi:hypothetical protein